MALVQAEPEDSDCYSECEDFDLEADDASAEAQELHALDASLVQRDRGELEPAAQPFSSNLALYRSLLASADLRFAALAPEEQVRLFASLDCRSFPAGQVVVAEGDRSRELYFVVGEGAGREVEVLQRRPAGGERVVTCLRAGQYFGERFFLYRRDVARNASVRVSAGCPEDLTLAVLLPDRFPLWEGLRHFLLVKKVPLFASLRATERSALFQQFYCRLFEDGELIIRCGVPPHGFV